MFLKAVIRNVRGKPESYIYYRLCEGYRDNFGASKWRNVMGLGRLEELDKSQREQLVKRLNEQIKGNCGLFSICEDEKVETYAQNIFNQLLSSGKIDLNAASRSAQEEKRAAFERTELVKATSLRHKEVREIGAEHLCVETARKLRLDRYLSSAGMNGQEVSLCLTQIAARAVHPASELATAEWIKTRSGICKLTGYPSNILTKDQLYANALRLLKHKDGLEQHLSRWTNELFNIDDRIILYDLTNTYFEGRMVKSKIAKFGRSKEKRSDCKLIVLAMVINQDGFPKHYQLFEGNLSDSASLSLIIDSLDKQMGTMEVKPTIVMDAGISTEANLELLRKRKYHYLCVSRSDLKTYQVEQGREKVQIIDNRKQPIELLSVSKAGDPDSYLWVRSESKMLKEEGMKKQFTVRFEEELTKIKESLSKKGGVKAEEKVNRRIGRAMQKYPSIQQNYCIEIEADNGIVSNISWSIKPQAEEDNSSGVYFLRTSLDETQETTLWFIYSVLKEVEYTFRVLKTDLDLRPVFHKTDEASLAHLHLAILAYWLVATIRFQLKKKGINHNWKQIVEIMDSHKTVTSTMETPDEKQVVIEKCSEPVPLVMEIYLDLNITTVPYKPKKSVRYQIKIPEKCYAD